MVANRDESGMVRLKAQEQIIDLLGLAAPSKHEVATHEMTPEDRRAAIGRVFGIRTEEATVKE
jgi:hypothetical protein